MSGNQEITTTIKYGGNRFPEIWIPPSIRNKVDEVGWRFDISVPDKQIYHAVVSFNDGTVLPGREHERFVPLSVVISQLRD